jgi:Tfp pilus assembly protein PilF
VRAELKKAMEIDPRLASAHIRLGRLELNQGDPAAAVHELKLALALDPSQKEIHFYLARAYQKMHDTEHAREEGKLCSELQTANRDTERNALKDLARRLGQTTF